MNKISENKRILIADDERNMRRVLSAMLKRQGFDTIEAENGVQALELMDSADIGCVITDLKMPMMDGLELLGRIRGSGRPVPVVLITAHGTVDTAVQAMKEGAFDYLTKPFDKNELLNIISKATKTADKRATKPTLGLFEKNFIYGNDPAMDEVVKLADRVASTDITVLITGETGTGKELIARAIHENGPRAKNAFVAINCAAIPEELTESELFGYEKGAFTGAVTSKPGRFELADKGTLFLDEVGILSPNVQAKLLRVLQEKSFERVGGIKTINSDTRLIAATNSDLMDLVKSARFREDLYYRLNVVQIPLPPLRKRAGDIMLLCDHFIRRFANKLGKSVNRVGDDATSALMTYNWPGNIRELENAIERAVLMADDDRIKIDDLPENICGNSKKAEKADGAGTIKQRVKDATDRLEKQLILEALESTGGNITKAAVKLGLSRKGLQIKMKALGLRQGKSDD